MSSWTPALDSAASDVSAVQSAGGISSVEFDGFEGASDASNPSDPYHAWWDPFATALGSGEPVLVDARLGHGGLFSLGAALVRGIRGANDPFFAFFAPAATLQSADPSWLFDPSFASCTTGVNAHDSSLCAWTSGNSDVPAGSPLLASGTKIAWINGQDYSMNDIVPRTLQGDPSFRIFGPVSTAGAYGEVSSLPPILGSWTVGKLQVLDMRVGDTFADAVGSSWQSGHGVVPDVVVVQKESDLLRGVDTVLAAAKAWLQP